jgi:hypothetical protein
MNALAAVLIVFETRLPNIAPEVRTEAAEAIATAVEATGRDTRFAIEIAELAVEESGLAPWVLDGRCNDPKWRFSKEGKRTMHGTSHCDGGLAVGAWQIHPDHGWVDANGFHPDLGYLNLYDASLYVVSEWALHPQRWTPWKHVKEQAARWHRLWEER